MYIDAHAHVDRYDLVGDHALESALAEITRHGVLTVSSSMDLPSYRRTLEISKACSLVVPTFGVHPWKALEYVDCLDALSETIEQSPMIGEIGLDHHFIQDTAAYPAQRKVLEYFLRAAREQEKIAILHTKGAEGEVLELLGHYDFPRVIVHWYSGPLDIFREMAAKGVYFTVGVEVLFSEHIRTIAREIPSRQLLTETDNPGGPKGFLGKHGMPVLVQEVVRGVAGARRTTTESIIQTVQVNLQELLRDDERLEDTLRVLEEWQSGG